MHKAFMYYWGLGHKQTLKSVAEKCGVSADTVRHWSVNFNWKARLGDMDRQVSEKLAADGIEQAAKIQKAHLKITANLTGRLEQFLKDNPNVSLITSMQDFERLVKTHLLLTDKPTEIVDQQITVISAVPSTRRGVI